MHVRSVFWLEAGQGSCALDGFGLLNPPFTPRLDFNGFYTERLEHMSAERSRKAVPQVAPSAPRAVVAT